MQLPTLATEQKPHVRRQCEQRNPVAPQLGDGVPAGKGSRPKQGFSIRPRPSAHRDRAGSVSPGSAGEA